VNILEGMTMSMSQGGAPPVEVLRLGRPPGVAFLLEGASPGQEQRGVLDMDLVISLMPPNKEGCP
jgi:hypothetical protein